LFLEGAPSSGTPKSSTIKNVQTPPTKSKLKSRKRLFDSVVEANLFKEDIWDFGLQNE